ncbi:MAG TPA: hypothetical protein VME20_07105, partial [Acidimicrobiales bacterium]|nr:hypothetical protein [Acidimicrobiales bacterium]
MNGEGSLHIDRGRWLYRFGLDSDTITIYRAARAGQELASPLVWRALAQLGVSDAFVVLVGENWQPFIEFAEGRERWALEVRSSKEKAEGAARHFLTSLADGVANASRQRGAFDKEEPMDLSFSLPEMPPAPAEAPV